MRFRILAVLLTAVGLVLAACGTDDGSSEDGGEMDHAEMDHSSSGEVPDDLSRAENPEYPVDSQAVINAEHMKGMDGAEATVTGAFDTTAYSVTYTPTTGGEPVEDHKWVIHEEIEDAADAPFEAGDEVVLEAAHMEGMEGAGATVDSAEDTTVYMVSYTDTESGDEVENHKWVTEEELTPAE
ncbi:YdhK family protein [Salinicoccus carnicancri]|uniref:YdhK family protein n=1 Tax=Salinicoccus carnicancri TaxID=558170 RepID=UPI0002F02112|nr:YdhK family protein [Salinicoccus carnicancri]